jgi:photosystem II stability/assembly factor-like uncharacterized protein
MRTPRPIPILILLLLAALPALAGDGRWTPLGPPRVGPLLDLIVDPAKPGTLYAVSFGEQASGLWKSVDSGERWFSINEGIPNSYTWSLDLDPFDPETLYALGSLNDRQVLYKSADGGAKWTRVYERSSAAGPYFDEIVPDPFVRGRLYARQDTRTYRSDGGGVAWAFTGQAGDPAGAIRLAADPALAGTLYMSVGDKLFRTTKSGVGWIVVHTSATGEDLELLGTGSSLYAAVVPHLGAPGRTDHCVRLEPDGKTETHIALTGNDICLDLVADPTDGRILYALSLGGRLHISVNGGITWAAINEGAPKTAEGRPLRVDFKTGALYLLGERGVFKSTDGGATWQTANNGFTTAALSVLVSTPGKKPAVFAAPRFERLLRTRNGGRTWTDAGVGPVTALAQDPSFPLRLLAAPVPDPDTPETSPRFYETRNQGETWSPLGALPVYDTVTRMAVSPGAQGKVIYAGTRDSGIFKSVNGGVTWRRASKGLPFLPACEEIFCPEERVTALEIDPRDPRIVYAVFSHQVVKSVNAGKTWDPVMDGLEDVSFVETLILDPESPNVLYIGTGEGVFKSTDGGATWRESSLGLPEPFGDFAVVDLAIDVRGEQTVLYAATKANGIFRSTDRGATWEPLNEGLPILLVDFVEIDGRRPGAVLAGTAGAGVWTGYFD